MSRFTELKAQGRLVRLQLPDQGSMSARAGANRERCYGTHMAKRLLNDAGPHPVDVHVGYRLRTRRAELGISQSALSEKTGVTYQQIQKYERGTNRISASMLFEFAGALSVSIGYFFKDLPHDSQGYRPELPSNETANKLASTTKAHHLLLQILSLPSPIRLKISSLILSLGTKVPEHEEDDE